MSEAYVNPISEILYATAEKPDWLIPDMLLRGTITCWAGEPGTGKSVLSYTMALAIAAGTAALSGLVPDGTPQRVLYFDQENSRQDRDQYLRWAWNGLRDSKGRPPDIGVLDQHFFPVHRRLGTPDWAERAADLIELLQPHYIVFDTAISAFALQDENDNAEAARTVNQLYQLMGLPVEGPAAISVLRHAIVPKDGKTKMRGASVWKSQTDQTIFQTKARGRPRRGGLAVTKIWQEKKRAFGLADSIYITPSWTDEQRTGLLLEGSVKPSREHRAKFAEDEEDDE